MCCSGEPFNFTAKDSNVHTKWESKDRQAQFKPHTGTRAVRDTYMYTYRGVVGPQMRGGLGLGTKTREGDTGVFYLSPEILLLPKTLLYRSSLFLQGSCRVSSTLFTKLNIPLAYM